MSRCYVRLKRNSSTMSTQLERIRRPLWPDFVGPDQQVNLLSSLCPSKREYPSGHSHINSSTPSQPRVTSPFCQPHHDCIFNIKRRIRCSPRSKLRPCHSSIVLTSHSSGQWDQQRRQYQVYFWLCQHDARPPAEGRSNRPRDGIRSR